MTKLKNWQLLSSEDVSPSPFFPIEKRKYKLPDGKVVDDFYVTTLQDSAEIIPITTEGKIVLIKIFKQGENRIVTQFPGGRLEKRHKDIRDLVLSELHEEAGISVKPEQLIFVYEMSVMTTKSSEHTHLFLAKDVEMNSFQNLDPNEDIEVFQATPQEVEALIDSGEINEGLTIAGWYLVKKKFPELF